MSLLAKIHAVRAQRLRLVKTGTVERKFKFASYYDVMDALQAPLDAAGLSIGFPQASLHSVQTQDGPADFVTVKLEVCDGVESVTASYDVRMPEAIRNQSGSAVTNAAQRTANAITYARRIGLLAFWNIVAGDEDQIERMTPGPGQSNIPGQVHITPETTWPSLTGGVWEQVASPLDDGLLQDSVQGGPGYMWRLWGNYPDHPGLCAWGYDRLMDRLEEMGFAWGDLMAQDADLPGLMTNCTPAQLRRAAELVAKRKKAEGGQS